MAKRDKAISIHQLLSYKPVTLQFEQPWLGLIGNPELTGSWIIWGNSGNGKTRFALQLAKYLGKFARVAYNSMEEGLSQSLRLACHESGLAEAGRRLILLDKEPIEDLTNRLSKPKSPQVIIIDSLQYSGLDYRGYKQLRDRFRNKLFIFISHADGKEPAGRTGKSIRFDANVKIWIDGYMAYATSRYGGGQPYTIWKDGAEKIHGIDIQKILKI